MSVDRYLFADFALPDGFQFPEAYRRLVEEGLPDIEPWWWLAEFRDSSLFWMQTLADQFPARVLVPFAKHGGSDDVACFDGTDPSEDPRVLYIHSFCSPGWESRGEASSFTAWLETTMKESQEFKAGEE